MRLYSEAKEIITDFVHLVTEWVISRWGVTVRFLNLPEYLK